MILVWLVILYIARFVGVPWYTYIPIAVGMIARILDFLMGVYEAGKESKDGRN